MPIPQSQSIRRVIESFQMRKMLGATPGASRPADIEGLPDGPGSTGQEIRDFEAKINAEDYPKELREAYFVSKSKNDYTFFNDEVKKYNDTLAADRAKFEENISSPEYPEELRAAYFQGKEKNDFTDFNAQIQKFNTTQETKLAAFEENINSSDYPAELRAAYYKSKKSGDYSAFNKAVDSYNSRRGADYQAAVWSQGTGSAGKSYTPEQLEGMQKALTQYGETMGDTQRQELQNAITEAKRFLSGSVAVGRIAGQQEYISKYDYDKIAAADKANGTNYLEILKDTGVTGLNAVISNMGSQRKENYQQWLKDNIKSDPYLNSVLLSKGERAAVIAYEKRYGDIKAISEKWIENTINNDPYLKGILLAEGKQAAIDAFNKRQTDLQAINSRWIDKNIRGDDYLNNILDTQGLTAALVAYNKRQMDLLGISERQIARIEKTMQELLPFRDKDGNYDLVSYIRGVNSTAYMQLAKKYTDESGELNIFDYREALNDMQAKNQKITNETAIERKLLEAGFDKEDIKSALYNAKLTGPQEFWQNATPWNEEKGEKATFGKSMQMAGEWLIPGVYSGIHWNEMSGGQKALNLGIDAFAILLPAGRGGFMAARGVAGTATRAGVMVAAGRGALQGAVHGALGAFDVILHPIGAAKATALDLRTFAEDIANPHKIPEMSVYTSKGTVRLKVTKNLPQAEAIKIRDKLMDAVRNGERVFVKYDGGIIELRRSALMTELPGSLTHTTPGGEVFAGGLKVKTKGGMSVKEQGLFVSPDPLPRFATSSAFGKGGTQPTIFIMSPETAAKTVNTGKVYASFAGDVVEMERKLPVGEKTKAIGQKLYTRIGPEGTRVEIWLEEGLKLSPKQIIKLKAKGVWEFITAPFSPALKQSGRAGMTLEQTELLAGELRRAGAQAEARELERAARLLTSTRASAPRLILQAGRGYQDIVGTSRVNTTRYSPVSSRINTMVNIRGITRTLTDGTKVELRDETEDERLPEREITRSRIIPGRVDQRFEKMRNTVEYSRTAARTGDMRGNARTGEAGRDTEPRIDDARGTVRADIVSRDIYTRTSNRDRVRPTDTRRTRTPIPPPRGPVKPPKKVLLKGRTDDEKKRKMIANAGGAIALRMGEVGSKKKRKEVWPTVMNDYQDNSDATLVTGAPPKGATIIRRGKGSAYGTAQMLRGEMPKKEVSIDYGGMDIKLTPGPGKRITAKFIPDFGGKTKGDIQIGRSGQMNPITEKRYPRFSPKSPPITQHTRGISAKRRQRLI